ncbi:MAG TPA: NAD(P)/FAD-dependent oxidoreductase [Vicinamibacterales bacterium]|nr:NAD(P)/FAD-dependent oxidoreductase [Vicinamibacterales bacterium]
MGVERPQILTTDAHNETGSGDCDVVVVGGGPSGLIAARDLAVRGARVTVLEEHDRIGAPVHCTGVLGLDAFDELDLPRRAVVGAATSARFFSPNGTSVAIEAERVRAAVVDRASFDSDLADAARDAGAAIHTGIRVVGLDRAPGSVVARTAHGSVRARAAVIACGASYRLNRALGLGVPSVLVHSAQLEVPFPAIDDVEVHFGRSVAPGGFAWIVPFTRHGTFFARVGLLCERDAGTAFRMFAASIRQRYRIASEWGAPRLRVLPLAPIDRTSTERILAIGDAAGLVKPTTGGGIYYGLLTGRLAAEVLAEALREDTLTARRLKEYDRRWRARLGAEIRAGLAFRAMAAKLNDVTVDRLMELARVDGIVPLLRQTADFNWHRSAARALLRHGEFRKIVLTSIFS